MGGFDTPQDVSIGQNDFDAKVVSRPSLPLASQNPLGCFTQLIPMFILNGRDGAGAGHSGYAPSQRIEENCRAQKQNSKPALDRFDRWFGPAGRDGLGPIVGISIEPLSFPRSRAARHVEHNRHACGAAARPRHVADHGDRDFADRADSLSRFALWGIAIRLVALRSVAIRFFTVRRLAVWPVRLLPKPV